MSITRATILAAVKEQVLRTDKDDIINRRIQWVVNDIADEFKGCRELRTRSASVTLTQYTASVDISSTLATLYGSRIRSVSLIDSANDDNNYDLTEISFEEYLAWMPDPDNPDSDDYDIPEWYALEGDYMYFKWVPDKTTYSVKINFGKVHPTLSASQDIVYPADWEECITNGTLARYYASVEDKTDLMTKHEAIYQSQKRIKLNNYLEKPNMPDRIACNW